MHSRESAEYMTLIEKRKDTIQSARNRSKSKSPDQSQNFGKVAAFNIKDLSMYAAVSQSHRNSNKRFMNKSNPPNINNSTDFVPNVNPSPLK